MTVLTFFIFNTLMCTVFIFSSGVKHVDKREGGGSHNWGTFEDDIKAEDDKINVSNEDVQEKPDATSHDGRSAQDAENVADDAAPKEEEEPKTFTLDEWKAQQMKKEGPKFNVRKAGEGDDIDPKWKKTYAYKKERETHEEDEEDVSKC